MKKQILLIMALLCLLVSCKSNETVAPEVPKAESSAAQESIENVREANKPFELLGTPDHIYIVKGENERTIEPGTDEYDEVLELLRSRFPEKLKEAARAITWADEAGFNRDMMRGEFDFLELSYDEAQTVKMNCMDSDYLSEEITFEMMIFPLTEITGTVSIDTHKTSGFVGRSYGPLDTSTEIIAELSGYSVVQESSPTESKTESEPDEPQSQNKETAESLQDTDIVSADNAPSGLVFLQDEPELKELKDAIHLMLRPDVKIFAHVSSSWDGLNLYSEQHNIEGYLLEEPELFINDVVNILSNNLPRPPLLGRYDAALMPMPLVCFALIPGNYKEEAPSSIYIQLIDDPNYSSESFTIIQVMHGADVFFYQYSFEIYERIYDSLIAHSVELE